MLPTLRIFLVSIFCTLAATTMAKCQNGTPVGSWEEFPNGISVNLTLNGNFLAAYVKNTSGSQLHIVGDGYHLVRIFYVDLNHKKIPLRDKSEIGVYANSKPTGLATIPQGGASPFRLKIELTPDQLAAIQTCPVFCRFVVHDPATREYSTIETKPELLTQAADK